MKEKTLGSERLTKYKIPKRFKLTTNNIDSIDIDIIRIFRILRSIPHIPNIEMIVENVKYFIGSVPETWNVTEIQIM
jgi:hypothetical protein